MKREIEIIRAKVKKGIIVYRGEGQVSPADPGDFGSGKYYSTLRIRARNYGRVSKFTIKFKNPYIIGYSEAYRTLVNPYNTLGHNIDTKTRGVNAMQLTRDMVSKSYDGLIAVRKDKIGNIQELEIVDYRPLGIEDKGGF